MDVKELEALAAAAFLKHGLKGWTFATTRAKRRLGACNYGAKRIEISEYYAKNNSRESIIDTLLHEIAHALAGPAAGHGPHWKMVAMRIGATPRACARPGEVNLQPGNWQATCPACGAVIERYRRPRSLTGYRCVCPGRGSLTFAFTGDPANMPAVPHSPDAASSWQAECPGCKRVHRRARRPRAGIWYCKCEYRCKLTWRFHSQETAR